MTGPQKEVQPKLPAPATVQGDTDQILQHQTLPSDASGIIDNDMRCIPENKLDRMSTVIEVDSMSEKKRIIYFLIIKTYIVFIQIGT